MKVKYNLKNNKNKIIDNVLGIGYYSKKLRKKPNKKIRSLSYIYKRYALIYSLFILIISISVTSNGDSYTIKFDFISIFFIIAIILVFLYLFYANLNASNKNNNSGTIEILPTGIKDINQNGCEIFFPYSFIEMIIIKGNLIVIKSYSPILMYFTITNNSKIINEIKKYNSDLLIIRQDK